ncbi:MAG: hypothetical protein ACKOCR_04590 [Burkholderiaceae bacterium]
MTTGFPILSLAIWLPLLSGAALIFAGRAVPRSVLRQAALAASVLCFLVTIPLITGFDVKASGMQFVEKVLWIERFGIHYALWDRC